MKKKTKKARSWHPDGYVMVHTRVRRRCSKHGVQDHMSILGDRCVECHKEGLLAQGLVKP